MKLSAFKKQLSGLDGINFMQVNEALVPAHFHITEIGLLTKHFVDCGGDLHTE